MRIRHNRRFKHTRDREDDILDLRGFISVKGVGDWQQDVARDEVTLEPVMEELEQAHERELQAARDADAAREAEAKKLSAELANVADEGAESDDGSTPTDAVNDAGQASLF